MSSRNHSPNFCFLEGFFLFLYFHMYWHRIVAAAAAFRGGQVLPASWRQRFPDARLKIHLRFNVARILWALLVMFHCRLWRFATQMIEVFFLFAQWWTVIHNPRLIRIQIRHSKIFHDGTCAGGWFWIRSRNSSLMTTVNHFVDECPYFDFHHFHTSDCSREHSAGCTPTLGGGGCPSMQQSGLSLPFVFVCFLHDLLSFLFPLSPLHLESTLLGTKDLLFVVLGFLRRASLRQISRLFWTIRNSRFPKFADQNHIRSPYFFLPRFTLESISYFPEF